MERQGKTSLEASRIVRPNRSFLPHGKKPCGTQKKWNQGLVIPFPPAKPSETARNWAQSACPFRPSPSDSNHATQAHAVWLGRIRTARHPTRLCRAAVSAAPCVRSARQSTCAAPLRHTHSTAQHTHRAQRPRKARAVLFYWARTRLTLRGAMAL